MNKPKFYRSNDKFQSFLLTAMVGATITLVSCIVDMIVNDKATNDPVSSWVIDTTFGVIGGFPLVWAIIHNIEYFKYYFYEYRPWKERVKQQKEAHATRVLTVERAASELFISELRKTK